VTLAAFFCGRDHAGTSAISASMAALTDGRSPIFARNGATAVKSEMSISDSQPSTAQRRHRFEPRQIRDRLADMLLRNARSVYAALRSAHHGLRVRERRRQRTERMPCEALRKCKRVPGPAWHALDPSLASDHRCRRSIAALRHFLSGSCRHPVAGPEHSRAG